MNKKWNKTKNRVVNFNLLSFRERELFKKAIRTHCLNPEGDVVFLSEDIRIETLTSLFPSESSFNRGEDVVVNGKIFDWGPLIINLQIFFPTIEKRL